MGWFCVLFLLCIEMTAMAPGFSGIDAMVGPLGVTKRELQHAGAPSEVPGLVLASLGHMSAWDWMVGHLGVVGAQFGCLSVSGALVLPSHAGGSGSGLHGGEL